MKYTEDELNWMAALPLRAFEVALRVHRRLARAIGDDRDPKPAELAGETHAIRQLIGWMSDDEFSIRVDCTRGETIGVLAGGVGTGKTVAACLFAMYTPGPIAFVTAAQFARMSRYGEERARVFAADLVILDDLGAEYCDAKGSFAADVDELFDHVYRDGTRFLIVTTNLTGPQFRQRYGKRCADRIREGGRWLPVTGKSLRRTADEWGREALAEEERSMAAVGERTDVH